MIIEPLSIPNSISIENLFRPLSSMPWAMWLDSCNSAHVDSRFDIITWQPKVTIETKGDVTFVSEIADIKERNGSTNTANFHQQKSNCYQSDADPLAILAKEQQSLFANITLPAIARSPEQDKFLPFLGGALGYFSYDLGHRFEQLPVIAERDIDAPDMAVGLYLHAIIFDRKHQSYALVCLDEHKQALLEFIAQHLVAAQKITTEMQHFKLTSSWQSNMSKQGYSEKFQQVQDYLLSGDCYQVNLAQRFSANYQGDEYAAYLALRAANKAPFSAFMRFENTSVLSVSPERFLQLSQGNIQSKPIKGTLPRAALPAEDQALADKLQQSDKDRAENLMIVDLLRNDISKVASPGSVKVPKLFAIESFPAVHHLVSTVEGQLSAEFDATDLLRGAFPGGSITGAPKIRSMEVIEQLEPHQRSVYCGSIGYISACGNMDTSITIRTLVSHNNNIYCWVGGGLVADSKVDSEYQETFDKVAKILPVLNEL